MSTYICFKCNHQWFKRSGIPPRRCPNHSCRTVKWGRPEDSPEKKSAVSPKLDTIEAMRSLMESIPVRKPVVVEPPKPQIPVDQPDYYSEPSINYD